MNTKISLFTSAHLNKSTALKNLNIKTKLNSSTEIVDFNTNDTNDTCDLNFKLWIQPQFDTNEKNKNYMLDFANLEYSDEFIVIYLFTLRDGRITSRFINEINILKEFFNTYITNVQFIYYNDDNTQLSYNDKKELKELISSNISSILNNYSIDINYIFQTNTDMFKNIITNIYNLQKNGMNKLIEPHTSFYGLDNVFDDRLLTNNSREL